MSKRSNFRMGKIIGIIERISLYTGTLILSVIVLLNTINIISRTIIGRGIPWVMEFSLILFVYAVLFTIPQLYSNNELITMDIIEKKLSEKAMAYYTLFLEIIIFMFLVIFTYHALRLSWGQRFLLSRGLQIPRALITLPASISGIVLIFLNLNKIISKVIYIIKYNFK